LVALDGDVRHPSNRLQAEIESSDALFHFAAQVAVTTSVAEPRYDFEVNAQGTFNILELVRSSHGKRPIVFYSSTNKVYGGLKGVPFVEGANAYSFRDLPNGIAEDCLLDFHSPYGCSKGAAEQYVIDYSRIYNLQTVVFRQSCIYGPRQFGVEDQGWIAWLVIAAVLHTPFTIYGTGKQVRDILFIDDLTHAFDLAWSNIDKASGQVYNIGGGPANAVSLMMLVDYLRKEEDLSLEIRYSRWRPGDQPVYVSDITKAGKQLDWSPKVSWREGVARLVHWVLANRKMISEQMSLNAERFQSEAFDIRGVVDSVPQPT
jgi:CDP-paratose 2-epimerase